MAGNMIGNVNTLQYQQQAEILSPVEVTITDGVLRWTVDFNANGHGIDRRCFRLMPVAGALKDFLKLADGEPESVQDFVLRRGVLGIAPHLDLVTWDGHKNTYTLSYREPIGVYQYLACKARTLLDMMHSLKEGTPIARTDARLSCMGGTWNEWSQYWEKFKYENGFCSGSLPPGQEYTLLLIQAQGWYTVADIRLTLSGLEVTHMGDDVPSRLRAGLTNTVLAPTQSPSFLLDWGDWHDGTEWDRERTGQFYRKDWQKVDFPHPEWELAANAGAWSPTLPSKTQRPSALFNALSFQLMQQLALPKDTFWCIQCGKPYTLDDRYERDQAANRYGEKRIVHYPRKPRKDTGGFCSSECEAERKRVQWCESKRRGAKKNGATE